MNLSPLIDCRGLSFEYGRRTIVSIDNLSVGAGEVTLLTGRNGSGKTTLLKILAGLLTASSGVIRCSGRTLNPRAAARWCRGRHIYLHQTPYMFDASVADNIAYGLRVRGVEAAEMASAIDEQLDWARLTHLAARHARQLSTGEMQRVALCRARVLAPPLLLLDEITANMDYDSRQRTYRMISDLSDGGSAVFFATHDLSPKALRYDHQITLDDGRLTVAAADTSQVIPLHREQSGDNEHQLGD